MYQIAHKGTLIFLFSFVFQPIFASNVNVVDSLKYYFTKYTYYSDFIDEFLSFSDEDYSDLNRELSLGFIYMDNYFTIDNKEYLLESIIRNDSIAKITLYSFKRSKKEVRNGVRPNKFTVKIPLINPLFDELVNFHKAVKGDSLNLERIHFGDFGFAGGKGAVNDIFKRIYKRKQRFSDKEIYHHLNSLYPEDRMWGYTIYYLQSIYDIKNKVIINTYIEKEKSLNDNFIFSHGCLISTESVFSFLTSTEEKYSIKLLLGCYRFDKYHNYSKSGKILELLFPYED
ncbi:MAG: hypothetical protein K1X55_03715 [Chitinophagales bacterium]|nr:hypothetical protein [Chitinophagales bacterium]